MRTIYLSWPAIGHINPIISLLKELVNMGHQVDFYGDRKYRRLAESNGFNFLEYNFKINDLSDSINPSIMDMASVISNENLKVLNQLMEINFDKYEYIIHDSLMVCGDILAKTKNIPSISTNTMFAINDEVLKKRKI